MDTSWITWTWFTQMVVSGLGGALLGVAVGFVPGRRAAEKSTRELNAVADKFTVELERLRQFEKTTLRAIEAAGLVDPINWKDGNAVGISSSLTARMTGGSGVLVSELNSTNSKPTSQSARP